MNFLLRSLLPVFLLLLTAIPLANASLQEFSDESGNTVTKPDPQKVKSLEGPSLSEEAAFHEPLVYTRKLVQGLETTRIIKITVPHPLVTLDDKPKKTPIKAIYLVDKDGIVIGYDYFTADKSEAVYETKINGIINYVEIYVECRQHGIWLKKVRLN